MGSKMDVGASVVVSEMEPAYDEARFKWRVRNFK
jgi:hypothetical protein